MCPPDRSEFSSIPPIAASADPSALSPALRSTTPPIDVRELFALAFKKNASDIHLTEHAPPLLRIDGNLEQTDLPPLSRVDTKRIVYSLLTDRQKAQFERELELDIAINAPGLGRFRANIHMQRGCIEAALRLVPTQIRSLEELELPSIVGELARRPHGLVLITGPTGMGKTTTLSAMVHQINCERCYHIITIEDPIEYIHRNRRSIIKQREVHTDTKSFANALVHALRQDPNVIVVGEMRDLETISTALTAAETGHLVLATLHTPDAAQTIDRILDVFPPHQQEEVKVQLAGCLEGVVSQQLLSRCDRPGRVLACEIMVATPAVRNLIREHATEQLVTILQTGAQHGMGTMDACIKSLYERKVISYETALSRMKNPNELKSMGKTDPSRKS